MERSAVMSALRAEMNRLGREPKPGEVSAVLAEQQDEWAAAPRRYFSQESMAKLRKDQGGETASLPLMAVS